jgi:hypothetical protein
MARKTTGAKPATSSGPFTIAGQTIYLDVPANSARRLGVSACVRDGALADNQTATLLIAACIGLCWREGALKAGAPRYAFRLLEYGEAMAEWLLEMGRQAGQGEPETSVEIIVAGNAALSLCLDATVTTEDLVQARGNSKPPKGDGSASA